MTAAAIVLSLALSGCAALVSPAKLERATGSLSLAATIDLQSAQNIASAKITATNGGMRREAVIQVNGGAITGSIDQLPIGVWEVRIELFDGSGDATHVAATTVRIYPNETVVAELVAQPLEAQLEIVVDLSGFPGAETIQNVRVTLTGNLTMTLKQDEDEPLRFSGTRELPPGDYDFNVGLFEESTYVADRVYLSPWNHARLVPGKTTRVVWQAQTGNTVIGTSIIDMPHPPEIVELDLRGEEIWLTWQASPTEAPASQYRIYEKVDLFAAYKLLAEVSGETFEHLIGKADSASPEAVLTVTAVSIDGLESYRSEPVRLADVLD